VTKPSNIKLLTFLSSEISVLTTSSPLLDMSDTTFCLVSSSDSTCQHKMRIHNVSISFHLETGLAKHKSYPLNNAPDKPTQWRQSKRFTQHLVTQISKYYLSS